jgi:tetratricopeptide (TPR) repeat protein
LRGAFRGYDGLADLQKAISLDSTYPAPYFNFGIRTKNDSIAIVYLQKCIQIDTNARNAIYFLGQRKYLQKKEIEAIVLYRQYLTKRTANDIKFMYYNLNDIVNNNKSGKYDKVIMMANVIIGFEEDKAIQSDGYYWRGNAYYNKADYGKAIADLDKAVEYNPKIYENYQMRGAIRMAMNNPKKAIEDFDKATEINPKNNYPYYWKAYLLFNESKYEQSIATLNKLMEIDSNYVPAYDLRAQSKLNLGYNISAIADFSSAITLDSTQANYYNFRGFIYEKIKAYQAAVQDFDKSILRNAQSAYPHFRKGSCLLYLGKAEEALLSFYKGEALDNVSKAHIEDKNKAIGILRILHEKH